MKMILDPTILFFCLGVLAIIVRSNIEIPPHTMKFLSYYLLMSIGFKGGISLAKSSFSADVFWTMVLILAASSLIPIWVFFLLRRRLSVQDAAGAAACYGSVSAVTFLTATSWLENRGEVYGGYMVAIMAMVESPAIIVGLILAKTFDKSKSVISFSLKETLHDAFFNGSVFILVGSLFIGYSMSPAKAADYQVFVYDIFKGFLCFFLLDLGMSAARQIRELKGDITFLLAAAVLIPVVNAALGLGLSLLLKLSLGDAFMLIIITASASYIAVPAALKTNLPEAKPSIYLSMALGLTFPFNILFGMPLYWRIAKALIAP